MTAKKLASFVLCIAFSMGVVRAVTNNNRQSGNNDLDRAEWAVSASNYKFDFQDPSKAIDGKLDSRWTLGKPQTAGDWVMIDMKKPQKFDVIELQQGTSANDFPRGYAVYVSANGTDWGQPVATGEGVKGDVTTINLPAAVEARYVKIALTKDVSTWWSIHELSIKSK